VKSDPVPVIQRLVAATNAHDLDEIVDCFHSEYRAEVPAHPGRSFVGRQQVKRNWAQILSSVPDVQVHVLRSLSRDEVVWTEWEMTGHRTDGGRFWMRGVIVFKVKVDRVAQARLYLEPVDDDGGDMNDAVRRLTSPM
jgi:ketosteroid isomerase-like protein